MKTIRNLITCTVFVLLCAGAALAQNVQTDYDLNFNLGNLRTYGFIEQTRQPGEALAASPINDRRIHDALDLNLRENGLSASNHPDFLIAYTVTTRKGLDIHDNRFGLWQRMGTVNVNQTTGGTLVVAFFDAKTNGEIWRGYAEGKLNPKNFEKDVNKAVAKLVQRFKKNQLGQK